MILPARDKAFVGEAKADSPIARVGTAEQGGVDHQLTVAVGEQPTELHELADGAPHLGRAAIERGGDVSGVKADEGALVLKVTHEEEEHRQIEALEAGFEQLLTEEQQGVHVGDGEFGSPGETGAKGSEGVVEIDVMLHRKGGRGGWSVSGKERGDAVVKKRAGLEAIKSHACHGRERCQG